MDESLIEAMVRAAVFAYYSLPEGDDHVDIRGTVAAALRVLHEHGYNEIVSHEPTTEDLDLFELANRIENDHG